MTEQEPADSVIVLHLDGDWCTIERETDTRETRWDDKQDAMGRWRALWASYRLGDGYADIEGDRSEMLAIAHAIEHRDDESFKRCAIEWQSDGLALWSPRNSNETCALISYAQADALAADIRKKLENDE